MKIKNKNNISFVDKVLKIKEFNLVIRKVIISMLIIIIII